MSLYHRLGHMKDTPLVKVGDWVKRGTLIGYCGSTGASSGPHCHYDVRTGRPPTFTGYVYHMSYAAVKKIYLNPSPYIKLGIPMRWTYPSIGFQYLQTVRHPNYGIYFHPGIDINGVNDSGAPIYSPVDGRVVASLGTTWVKQLGKLVGINYNGGWGNMVVIEQSPDFKL